MSQANTNPQTSIAARPLVRQREREREQQPSSNNNHPHNRCILLFDMDCFYAQCERVRLGLPLGVKLCLFQWNSVLAVTYPSREYGIKRGDSWDDVAKKYSSRKRNNDNNNNNNDENKNDDDDDGCWNIHLPIIRCDDEKEDTTAEEENNANNKGTGNTDGDDGDNKNEITTNNQNDDDDNDDDDNTHDIEANFRKVYELSRDEQLKCQREENGVRHFHSSGKACLERYRLASIRIFSVVLESLQERVTRQTGYSFVLEKASVDEFYLDLTDYCYQTDSNMDDTENLKHGDNAVDRMSDLEDVIKDEGTNKTVVAGHRMNQEYNQQQNETNDVDIALNRACQVSNWIREDIWKILGFTMSCGISTNKTMAKLTASYGKPNGQAVLYPRFFPNILRSTKITKVRNFGGKLGKNVLAILLKHMKQQQQQQQSNISNITIEDLSATATMADLNQIPLLVLLQSKLLSQETAHFVFQASQGIDHEAVKNTTGALVKSITAFKTFPATRSHADIFDMWLKMLSKEIIGRVAQDTARNNRYPKSCTLNYTYFTRSQRQSRSIRLTFPSEREVITQKSAYLVAQAKPKLISILKDHPLRGIGLSVSNFESKRDESMPSIQSFFSAMTPSSLVPLVASTASSSGSNKNKGIAENAHGGENCGKSSNGENATENREKPQAVTATTQLSINKRGSSAMILSSSAETGLPSNVLVNTAYQQTQNRSSLAVGTLPVEDEDLNLAKKLQASFGKSSIREVFNQIHTF
jgi:nucleotidyltransferase/DNA polymerase involved in DNA repair